MSATADTLARVRTLTDHDSTLLVEAAAGTGKTALIAGRLTMLLAAGLEPSSLAAITFTEAAASELSDRVHRYVDQLLHGETPLPLREALPNGLCDEQRQHLAAAQKALDELTASTIHGFCQTILTSYAVEADIDPGARIIDAVQVEVAFDAVFDRWLRKRLTTSGAAGDPVAALSRQDPRHVVSVIRAFARFRRDRRAAHAPQPDWTARPEVAFSQTVQDFRTWLSQAPDERRTAALVTDLETLAAFYADCFATRPDFEKLWALAHPPRLPIMQPKTSNLARPRLKGAWSTLVGPTDGTRLHDEMLAHFDRVDVCYRALLGQVATALAATLSGELDEVLVLYEEFKRAAAVLDFDDLLYRARDLVATDEPVRHALGQRYRRILVDEFQDTDPVQAEILFRIAATDCPADWSESALRDGALFMVGDPKQAIYRFRGADIETYTRARSALERTAPGNIIHVTASFRSLPDILAHVNRCFADPLSATGQPGYVQLTSTRTADSASNLPCVAKRTLTLPDGPKAGQVRQAEARAIADICAGLIGNVEITDDEGKRRPLAPGDIALLTPAATEDFWIYERALEARALPFASLAGKNLYGRQEVQDLLCIARILADPDDTLAFGALMRGPVVGLTEEELLDITASLPPVPEMPELIPCLCVRTHPDDVRHPLARDTLVILRDLWRRAESATPMLLLSEAIERFALRPLLAAREGDRSSRALANVDAFLELARGYEVRGLRPFARDVTEAWSQRESRPEGQVDSDGDGIAIVTMHSAKGLEWPVVILINTVTWFPPRPQFVHRRSDNTLHWVIGEVLSPELEAALEAEAQNDLQEKQRVLYVASTRARDLLVLPEVPNSGSRSWTNLIHGQHHGLPELDLSDERFAPRPIRQRAEPSNEQSAEVFAAQRSAIAERKRHVTWLRPSNDDLDRFRAAEQLLAADANDADDANAADTVDLTDTPATAGAGRLRGLVLHKLMEEILTAETVDDAPTLTARAHELLGQLAPPTVGSVLPSPGELSVAVLRTLQLPDIATLRHSLLPEVAVYGTITEDVRLSVAGRADAIHFVGGRPDIAIDWKSDIAPSNSDIEHHAAQLRTYLRATNIPRGAIVYMSTGKVRWLDQASQ